MRFVARIGHLAVMFAYSCNTQGAMNRYGEVKHWERGWMRCECRFRATVHCKDRRRHVVLDQLDQWNRDPQSKWKDRFPLEHVGMSGHSFGAITTQAVSGQNYPLIGQKYLDARIDAALLLSPSPPAAGSVERAFDQVPIPWMLMTGTRDSSAIGVSNPQDRMKLFPHLPKTIDRYQLVLDEARHSAFTDSRLPEDGLQRKNPITIA